MKLPFLVMTLTLAALLAAQPSQAQNAFTPDQVKYGPAPPFLPVGAQLAVLEGDPMASSGDFTIRLKMPDGYKVAPHTHPSRENVTVLSGTLKVGMGDQFDASKMMSFGAGSFAYLDPSMHHYAAASGETIIQINGMSPVKLNNPKAMKATATMTPTDCRMRRRTKASKPSLTLLFPRDLGATPGAADDAQTPGRRGRSAEVGAKRVHISRGRR